MTITHLTTKETVLLRMADLGSNKMAYSTVTSELMCEIQPLLGEKDSLAEGVFGKKFAFFTDGVVSLYPGDRIRDEDGNNYTIRAGGVSSRQMGGLCFVRLIAELT